MLIVGNLWNLEVVQGTVEEIRNEISPQSAILGSQVIVDADFSRIQLQISSGCVAAAGCGRVCQWLIRWPLD